MKEVFEHLTHSSGNPAPHCPVCKASWDDGVHTPVQESRGWDAKENVPVWAWTCASCCHFDLENNPVECRQGLAEDLLKKADAGGENSRELRELATRLNNETDEGMSD